MDPTEYNTEIMADGVAVTNDLVTEIEMPLTEEPQTIPGVRILFTNGQTFDLPTISQIDEEPPSFQTVLNRFRDTTWLKLGASNIAINTATVSAVSEILIKVADPNAPQDNPEAAQG